MKKCKFVKFKHVMWYIMQSYLKGLASKWG